MRVINQNHETITNYDLNAGYLVPTQAVREGAVPIDNKTKWAWAEEDWEEVLMYFPHTGSTIAEPTTDDVLNTLLGVTV